MGCSPFSHLLFGPDYFFCVLATYAEIDGDIKAAIINSFGPLKDIKVDFFELFLEAPDRFPGRNEFVQVPGIAFVCICQYHLITHSDVPSFLTSLIARFMLPDT